MLTVRIRTMSITAQVGRSFRMSPRAQLSNALAVALVREGSAVARERWWVNLRQSSS
jgi:hypothetical protein